jgi:integral membrane protein
VSIVTALRNYRVAAWVTGIGLLVLVFVAMPLKYVFGDPRLVGYVGMLHGFLYMAYIVCTLVLAERCRWRPFEALVILLAGTVPIASFVAERQVARRVQENRPVLGGGRSGADASTPR